MMNDQQFKDTLTDWHAECVSHERNSGLHTAEREARIVQQFDQEYAEMLAFVEALQADAQLGAMVRRMPVSYILDHSSQVQWVVRKRMSYIVYFDTSPDEVLSAALKEPEGPKTISSA